jgi:hypothetical protein
MTPIYVDREGVASFARPMPLLRFGPEEVEIAGARFRIGNVPTATAKAVASGWWPLLRCRALTKGEKL